MVLRIILCYHTPLFSVPLKLYAVFYNLLSTRGKSWLLSQQTPYVIHNSTNYRIKQSHFTLTSQTIYVQKVKVMWSSTDVSYSLIKRLAVLHWSKMSFIQTEICRSVTEKGLLSNYDPLWHKALYYDIDCNSILAIDLFWWCDCYGFCLCNYTYNDDVVKYCGKLIYISVRYNWIRYAIFCVPLLHTRWTF